MTEALSLLFNLSVLIFVLASMFGMGLGLTLKQIFEPMRNVPLVLKALAANFILAPLLAFALAKIIGLDQQLSIGLFILGVAAGAPLLAKYAQLAEGNLAFTVGLMVLLMVATIIYAPLVLPLLMPDVQVDVWGMLQSLVLTMLIPLVIGLVVKARYEPLAESLVPYMSQASSITLMMQVVLGLLLAAGDLLGILGTGAILAALLFLVGNLILGYLLGGPGRDTRVVVGLGTAQRNVSAAMLITVQNFAEPKVLIMVLTGALLMLVINSLVASEFGKRYQAVAPAAESA
jgi:BASS family bile acid:Na+ symporter